jgi:DNA-binding NarL/FixJ family response regulator
VIEKRTLVLVAGIGEGPFEALVPILDRQKLDVVRVASPENSVELALSEPFDLMIFNAEIIVGTLAMVVDAIRDEMSASRTTSLLVLTEPGNVEAARDLIGRGVNRVMLLDDTPELIGQQVAELLNVAPRAAIRLTVRLKTSVADGAVEVLGNVVNLSTSGMLIETDTLFEPEEQVVVSINLGDQWGSVAAKAMVVRQAHHDRDGVDGIGIRFLSLAGNSKAKIEAFLDEAFADQLGD